MTEENTVPVSDDLDQSLETETSFEDDSRDPEEALLDTEVTTDELADDDEEESETEEDSEEEAVTESEEEAEENSENDEDEEQPEEDTASDEERKKAAQEAFKEREARRLALEQQKREQQQEYLDAAEDAKDLALRQLQVEAYNNRIQGNLTKLESGIDRAIANIDLFEKGSDAAKEELARSLDVFERLYVVRDANGDPVEVRGDVYQYLQENAERIRRLTGDGARQQVKDKKLTKAKVDPLPARTPKEPKKDPALSAFEEEADRW